MKQESDGDVPSVMANMQQEASAGSRGGPGKRTIMIRRYVVKEPGMHWTYKLSAAMTMWGSPVQRCRWARPEKNTIMIDKKNSEARKRQ